MLPIAVMLMASCTAPQGHEHAGLGPRIVPTGAMTDPLEPVNRGIWAANRGMLENVIHPGGRAWRAVVPEPARMSIKNFARNATYPGRVVNHMLQGRWDGAGDESVRFLTNTTAGVGGFFDVATRWEIPKSDADFAETFMKWGWRPQTYLMLPVFGPSDECHSVGLAGDRLANPLNYYEPLRYATAVSSFNYLSATTGELLRFIETSSDSYEDGKLLWVHSATPGTPDMSLRGPVDVPTLETLGLAKIRLRDRDFIENGRRMHVRLDTTGRRVPFNCWIQKEPAPLVYINPGVGGHRLAMLQLSIAEHLFENGYSVVTTSSAFHPEFMDNASMTHLPGHPPTDRAELMTFFKAIDERLEDSHPGKLGERSLIGYSMGGFHTLQLAATENQRGADLLHFSRYVAINPPVELSYGVKKIDSYATAPDAWPAAERGSRIDNTFLKTVYLAKNQPAPGEIIPLEATESKFLIGVSFRLVLRDMIFASQSRNNLGVLKTPISNWRRDSVYQEILGYRFEDYFMKMLMPYYLERGVKMAEFKREADLKNFSQALSANRKVRLITNANDFIHAPGDVRWMRNTLGTKRVQVFPNGGHLGNLAEPHVQAAILKALQ